MGASNGHVSMPSFITLDKLVNKTEIYTCMSVHMHNIMCVCTHADNVSICVCVCVCDVSTCALLQHSR